MASSAAAEHMPVRLVVEVEVEGPLVPSTGA
jgi:hypothetical protein